MADIQTNIKETIAQLDAIEDAIEEMGVPVGNIPTAQYPEKIATIPGQPAKIYYSPQGRAYIKNIVLPEGVAALGEYAFAGDNQLFSVEVQAGLKVIGKNSFENCTALVQINLPAGTEQIDSYAFSGCENLEQVPLPSSLAAIGNNAFMGSGIKSVTIPDAVTSLGACCFQDCTSLAAAKLPTGLSMLNAKLFMGCSELKEITIPAEVADIAMYAFSGCTKLQSVQLPSGIKSIKEYAFQNTALESVAVPNSTEIGRNCFAECAALTTAVLPEDLTILPQAIFQNCSALENIMLPEGVSEISTNAFYGCSSLKTFVFPANLKTLGQSSFSYSNIEEAILPDGIETIKGSVFSNCQNLKKLYLPSSLNSTTFMIAGSSVEEVILGKGYHLDLDISASTKYSAQMLVDCIYQYENRVGKEALTFKIGNMNLAKLSNVYVTETAQGLEIVTETTPGAILATQYADNKNIKVI